MPSPLRTLCASLLSLTMSAGAMLPTVVSAATGSPHAAGVGYIEIMTLPGRTGAKYPLAVATRAVRATEGQDLTAARELLRMYEERLQRKTRSLKARMHLERSVLYLRIATASNHAERHQLIQSLPVERVITEASDGSGLITSFIARGKVRVRIYRPYSMGDGDRGLHAVTADDYESPDGSMPAESPAPHDSPFNPCYDDEEGTIVGTCPTQGEIDDYLATIADTIAEGEDVEGDYDDTESELCSQYSCEVDEGFIPLEEAEIIPSQVPCYDELSDAGEKVGYMVASHGFVANRVAGQVAGTAVKASVALWGGWAVLALGTTALAAFATYVLIDCFFEI